MKSFYFLLLFVSTFCTSTIIPTNNSIMQHNNTFNFNVFSKKFRRHAIRFNAMKKKPMKVKVMVVQPDPYYIQLRKLIERLRRISQETTTVTLRNLVTFEKFAIIEEIKKHETTTQTPEIMHSEEIKTLNTDLAPPIPRRSMISMDTFRDINDEVIVKIGSEADNLRNMIIRTEEYLAKLLDEIEESETRLKEHIKRVIQIKKNLQIPPDDYEVILGNANRFFESKEEVLNDVRDKFKRFADHSALLDLNVSNIEQTIKKIDNAIETYKLLNKRKEIFEERKDSDIIEMLAVP